MTILEVQRAICSRFSMTESIEIEKAIEHYISRRVDEEVMEKQAKALVLVTPKEVDDKVQELFPYAKVTRTNVACNEHAYNNGVNDGCNAMRTPAIG